MNKESLVTLINKTKENVKALEEKIFNDNKAQYSIYRAETAIYLDNLKFIEKLLNYELNQDEIDSIASNLNEMNEIIEKDFQVTAKEDKVEASTYNTQNDFNSINFDTIAEEVNKTQPDYSSIQQFVA